MSSIDWAILGASLVGIVLYGLWRGRGNRDLGGYLLADRTMPWPIITVSIMATQASAITFLSTPGQGFADGMRFLQFYFGLPVAMVILAATAVPIYHRLRVYTAYEYLERRFDAKTRALAAALFLVQRGLAAGLTIYAPSLILSVLLGWNVHATIIVIGALVVTYTASGGSKAVNHTQLLQMGIIFFGFGTALVAIVRSLPDGVTLLDAARVAGAMTSHPAYVAGTGRLCTDLMNAVGGRVFAKVGAEGYYCAGAPERRLGVALKIEDGAKRAAEPALLAVLQALDLITEAELTALAGYARPPVFNTRAETVGHIVARVTLV